MSHILVIDDDVDICTLLNRYLSKNGFVVSTARSGKAALESMLVQTPDIVLCDFRLDDMTGGELLEKINFNSPQIPVIIMTGYSDVRTAVQMIKLGAVDYVTKPLLPEEILLTLKRALEKISQKGEEEFEKNSNTKTTKTSESKYLLGKSRAFEAIIEQVKLVAPTNFSVIIYGESGSGKESVANEIHNNSDRADKPFVAIDCGSLSKELAGSELFGHEKGSFTSAINQKIGSFELANGGTIFLDEIGNLSYDVQVALLRVVQERKIRRVGGTKDIELDVRLIVASNERLSSLAKKGKFREDLYHRFNEFSIEVPALRNRQDDIMLFAEFFLQKTNSELNKSVIGFSDEVMKIFCRYNWPGNLRELNNVIKRSTLLASGDLIEVAALPFEITYYDKLNFERAEPEIETNNFLKKNVSVSDYGMKQASLGSEIEVIEEALRKCGGNRTKAAEMLNIDRKTLYNKMKQFRQFNGEL